MNFFCLIYLLYEVVDILKNMSEYALSVEKICERIGKFHKSTIEAIV